MENSVFEAAASQLEKSIKPDVQPSKEAESLKDVLLKAATDFLNKGKGGQGTDLEADKDKRGSLIEAGKDPAEHPVKSGQGYKDSSKYEARKGDDEDDMDDEDEDEKESMFKKKKKKMKKKMDKSGDEDESEDEVVDATEFVEDLGDAVDHINKSVERLEAGMVAFGDLLVDMADPRREKLLVTMAKAISHVIEKQDKIEKSLSQFADLKKAMKEPSAPKVAGQTIVVEGTENKGSILKSEDKNRLFQLASKSKISMEEYKNAVKTGDISILDRFKA